MATSWVQTAEQMVATACLAAWRSANVLPNGQRRRKHVSYSVPEWCAPLLDAAHRGDEHETKRLMLVVRGGLLTLV